MRIGKFYLSSHLIENKYSEVANILSQLRFVPFHVEHLYSSSRFLMEGMSEKFNEVEEGQAIPFYDLEIIKVYNKSVVTKIVKSSNQF